MARSLWTSVAESEQDTLDMESLVESWVEAHPLTDLSFARPSSIGQFADLTQERGGTLQQVQTLEEQISNLATQVRIYLAGIHKQLRGEIEFTLDEALGTEGLAGLVSSVETIGASVERLATTAEQLPGLVREERRLTLEELDRQRELVLEAVSAERHQLVEAIVAERLAALDAIARERTAAFEDLSHQRLETLTWLASQITTEREEVLREVEGVVASGLDRAKAKPRTSSVWFSSV